MAQTVPEGCLGAVAQEALSPWPLKFEPLTSCGMATQTTRNELPEPPASRSDKRRLPTAAPPRLQATWATLRKPAARDERRGCSGERSTGRSEPLTTHPADPQPHPDHSQPARISTSASARTVPAGCGSDRSERRRNSCRCTRHGCGVTCTECRLTGVVATRQHRATAQLTGLQTAGSRGRFSRPVTAITSPLNEWCHSGQAHSRGTVGPVIHHGRTWKGN